MTAEKFHNELLATSCKGVAYRGQESELDELPFVTYAIPSNDDFYADDEHYAEIGNGWLELYSAERDPALQREIIAVFKRNKISYKKENEDYIEEEAMFLCRFVFQIIMESEE